MSAALTTLEASTQEFTKPFEYLTSPCAQVTPAEGMPSWEISPIVHDCRYVAVESALCAGIPKGSTHGAVVGLWLSSAHVMAKWNFISYRPGTVFPAIVDLHGHALSRRQGTEKNCPTYVPNVTARVETEWGL